MPSRGKRKLRRGSSGGQRAGSTCRSSRKTRRRSGAGSSAYWSCSAARRICVPPLAVRPARARAASEDPACCSCGPCPGSRPGNVVPILVRRRRRLDFHRPPGSLMLGRRSLGCLCAGNAVVGEDHQALDMRPEWQWHPSWSRRRPTPGCGESPWRRGLFRCPRQARAHGSAGARRQAPLRILPSESFGLADGRLAQPVGPQIDPLDRSDHAIRPGDRSEHRRQRGTGWAMPQGGRKSQRRRQRTANGAGPQVGFGFGARRGLRGSPDAPGEPIAASSSTS